jgi:endonuclease/exonuclease/phosphatase family metal-dependent hydrolase
LYKYKSIVIIENYTRIMKNRILIILVILTLASSAYSQDRRQPNALERIKVLTWNIYMLPKFIKNSGKMKRAKKIGEVLDSLDYDVIVFQEAFHKGARRKIRKNLEEHYPYQAGPANCKFISLKTNSGLWIFSKHPITNSKSIRFKIRSGIDAFSRKGAIVVELNVNGQHIQIAGTHLQNSGGNWIKHGQCVEFYNKLIKPLNKLGVPQIICGDFNINKDSAESYKFMLHTLQAEDGELKGDVKYTYDRKNNDLHVEEGINQDLIDYILIRNNGSMVNCSGRRITPIQKRWHKHCKDLSDHYSIEAEIYFNNVLDLSAK